MRRVEILDRVPERHPDLCKRDVAYAWDHVVAARPRTGGYPGEHIAVGIDPAGRAVEMAACRADNGRWLVFHAQTPPSSAALKELGIDRRAIGRKERKRHGR